jgi:hypothetical protein
MSTQRRSGIVIGMIDVASVFEEYAKTMHEAQLFETALQVVAATELDRPDRKLTKEELQERTERFLSRGIAWIQQRLELSPEFAQEIDALRRARNELAHGYLLRMWLSGQDAGAQDETTAQDAVPEHLRGELDVLVKAIDARYEDEARATLAELQSLRARFAACVTTLTSRWFSREGWGEASSWAEVERLARETD